MSKSLIKNLMNKFNSDFYSIEEEIFLYIEELEQQLKTCRNDIEIIDGHFKNGWIHELAEALKDD